MAAIKSIGQETVNRICSGQVILDLATAVKELLENSLDAGASSIEIRLKQFGKYSIEVSDNGNGVKEHDFQSLTLKHHTSKLQNFLDLTKVETFGFRGEALSSLCALSSVIITTRHKSAKLAHQLEFDNNGEIVKKLCTARQPGTTVTLGCIFHTLPVRHKEFEKNIKREYAKLLNLLNAYCLISGKVRIICINENEKGNKSVVLSTSGSSTLVGNISAIFGSKQNASLMNFVQVYPSVENCEIYHLEQGATMQFCKNCVISGLISSSAPGLGRNSSDRQYYYINKRPCEMPRLSKMVNEVFHSFNRQQFPFVHLDISINREEVDINVTPDKRSIFMQKEKVLMAIIKTSLLKMYDTGRHVVGAVKTPKLLSNYYKTCGDGLSAKAIHQTNIAEANGCEKIDLISDAEHDSNGSRCLLTVKENKLLQSFESSSSLSNIHSGKTKRCNKGCFDSTIVKVGLRTAKYARTDSVRTGIFNSRNVSDSHVALSEDSTSIVKQNKRRFVVIEPVCETKKKEFPLQYNYDAMKQTLSMLKFSKSMKDTEASEMSNFTSKIFPSECKQAEAELTKHLSKASFRTMDIIGQFNLGFIIARNKNDLFIIDQHASDEKYNFEMLQKSTRLSGQPLLVPQKLNITAGEVLVIQENIDIFCRNGFSFNIGSQNGQSVAYLTKVPMSRSCTFDYNDVSEMIFMLADAPNIPCRPSKVRQMFASRACRKSVMVGLSMTHPEMKRVVHQMAEIDQPWNCPHGRPTLRHLIDLSMVAMQCS